MAEFGAWCNDLDVVRTKESCHGILRWIGRGSGRNEPLHRGQRRQNGREVKASTEPTAIRSALEGYADRLSRIGVEASSLGLYRELQAEGLPIIVVEARHMRVSLSTMRNKTDSNDSRPNL